MAGIFDTGIFDTGIFDHPASGAQDLAPDIFTNAQTIYAHSVTQYSAPQSIQPSLYSNEQTFYQPSLSSLVSLTPATAENTQTFNAHTLTSRFNLSAVRYENGQAFYSAKLGLSVYPALTSNAQAFYSVSVSQTIPTQTVLPLRVDNQSQFFGADVSQRDVISPSRAGFEMGGQKVYIKRGKRIHIFDTVEDADAWVDAETQAKKAIQTAKGQKKVKAKAKVYKALEEQMPHEVIRLDWLENLIAHFNIPVELPTLEAKQDWLEVARISLLAQQMLDEEDVELLLMA